MYRLSAAFASSKRAANIAEMREEIRSRLIVAIMSAHVKYRLDGAASWNTYAQVFISRAASHWLRDYSRLLRRESVLVPLDDIQEPASQPAEPLEFDELLSAARALGPLHGQLARLLAEGCAFNESATLLGISIGRAKTLKKEIANALRPLVNES